MSDFNSSLPIRTESNGDAAVKIVDGTITSRQLTVNADGSVNITDNGGSLTVDATDLDIRDLTFASDKVDASGSTNIGLDAATLAALESITVQNPAGAGAVNIQDGGNSITVDATDLDIRNLVSTQDNVAVHDAAGDQLAINTDGSINVVVLNDVPGTEICDRQTSASVASSASVNHDYTVTALKTFTGEQVVAAGSGKIKVQVLFNGVIKFDAFNSTANPTIIIPLLRMIKAAAGQVVRITITNLDNQAQDLYSTLMGSETP